MNNFLNKKILLIICGGISAYKSLELIRSLKKRGAQIKTILTESAKQLATALYFIDNFADNEVTRAQFKDTSETVYAHGTSGGSIALNHGNGHYQTITTNASVTLSFTNFPPSGQVGRIILDITCADVAHTLTIPSSVLVADNVSGGDGSSDTITFPDNRRFLYEFLTPDGGTTILMHQLGKIYT